MVINLGGPTRISLSKRGRGRVKFIKNMVLIYGIILEEQESSKG